MSVLFAHMSMYMVPLEVKRRHQIPQELELKLLTTVWVLGLEPGSSATRSTHNC